jgi:hypothetical protein
MGPRNRFKGINSASLCSLAGRYDNPLPPRFLAPIDSLKIPALYKRGAGPRDRFSVCLAVMRADSQLRVIQFSKGGVGGGGPGFFLLGRSGREIFFTSIEGVHKRGDFSTLAGEGFLRKDEMIV